MSKSIMHWVWLAFLLTAIVWFSWFFRYDQFERDPYFVIDRWTGELVIAADHDAPERILLSRRPAALASLPPPPASREWTDAEVFGGTSSAPAGDPFADLIPSERKKPARMSDGDLDAFLNEPINRRVP